MEILFSKVSRKIPSKLPNDIEPCKNKKSKSSNTEASVFETQTLPSTDKTIKKQVTCKKKKNHLQSQQTILFPGPGGLTAAHTLMSILTFLREQQEYGSKDRILKPGI